MYCRGNYDIIGNVENKFLNSLKIEKNDIFPLFNFTSWLMRLNFEHACTNA